jgi:hypothetical protein
MAIDDLSLVRSSVFRGVNGIAVKSSACVASLLLALRHRLLGNVTKYIFTAAYFFMIWNEKNIYCCYIRPASWPEHFKNSKAGFPCVIQSLNVPIKGLVIDAFF